MEPKEVKLTLTDEVVRYIQAAMTLTTQLQSLGVTVAPASDSTWNMWNARAETITNPIKIHSSLAIGPATKKEETLVLRRPHPPSGNLPLQPAIEDFPGLTELLREEKPMDQENRASRTESLRKMEEKLRSQELTGSVATSASSNTMPTTAPANFHDSLKQEWTVLEERARRCRRERQAAERAEEEANAQVAQFLSMHGPRALALAGDFANKVRDAIALRQRESLLRAQWQQECKERREKEAKEKSIREELEKKRKEMEALQEQLKSLHRSKPAHKERPPSKEPVHPPGPHRTPGFYAVEGSKLPEPCNKWAGPRKDLRGIRSCNTCNLTGVPRSSDCPNYFHHSWWIERHVPRYSYSREELNHKKKEEDDSSTT